MKLEKLFVVGTCVLSVWATDIFDRLLQYAYLSKVSYCIDGIIDSYTLSEPVKVQPQINADWVKHRDNNSFAIEQKVNHHLFTGKIEIVRFLNQDKPLWSTDTDAQGAVPSVGFIALDHDKHEIIVSFRGTYLYSEFLTDIATRSIAYVPTFDKAKQRFADCIGCRVHKGFYTAFELISSQVFEKIEDLLQEHAQYSVVTTGHSMGGAFAVLAGIELALMGIQPLIVTYGTPKLLNHELNKYFDSMFPMNTIRKEIIHSHKLTTGCIRVVHKNDYVPSFPPFRTFEVSGLEFYIDKHNLPHHQGSVTFHGSGENHPTLVPSGQNLLNQWRDLLTFSPNRIFHIEEHRYYFYQITMCDDVHFG